jgi:DNA-binding phage protein
MKLNDYTLFETDQVAEFLKELMEEKGISMYALSKKTGLSKEIIYNILRIQGRERDYSFGSILTIMRALGVHIELSELNNDNSIHKLSGGYFSDN